MELADTYSMSLERLSAGCTAVVALKHGDELYVANAGWILSLFAVTLAAHLTRKKLCVMRAGDSRAVLCRGDGEVYPLSFDHKPSDVSFTSCVGQCSFIADCLVMENSLNDLHIVEN